jgi:hypothetical protein
LPVRFDLRQRGWRLIASAEPVHRECVRLTEPRADIFFKSLAAHLRDRSIVLGVNDSAERALWLARGFGDVLPEGAGLDEIAARARRLLAPARAAVRHHGRLALDPAARDASVDGRRLGLFPREFALLWRLAEEPGAAVSRTELLHDVLGLRIEPRTNTLAVHICRLRKKMHAARLSHLLVTGATGGSYALLFDAEGPVRFGTRIALDDGSVSGEDSELLEEAAE